MPNRGYLKKGFEEFCNAVIHNPTKIKKNHEEEEDQKVIMMMMISMIHVVIFIKIILLF